MDVPYRALVDPNVRTGVFSRLIAVDSVELDDEADTPTILDAIEVEVGKLNATKPGQQIQIQTVINGEDLTHTYDAPGAP
jgi:hypothetical protein